MSREIQKRGTPEPTDGKAVPISDTILQYVAVAECESPAGARELPQTSGDAFDPVPPDSEGAATELDPSSSSQLVTSINMEFKFEGPAQSPPGASSQTAGSHLPGSRPSSADPSSFPRTLSRGSFDSAMSDTGCLFGFDIGGSLAKFVLFVPHDRQNRLKPLADKLAAFFSDRSTARQTSFQTSADMSLAIDGHGTFLFMSFESKDMERVLDIVEAHDLAMGMRTLSVAGGGAYRFETLLHERLGLTVQKVDELATVVHGIAFMMENSSDELYAIEHPRFGDESIMKRVTRMQSAVYPFILVNIGSGVSILHVKDAFDFERVSGSALGGATYWGLCKLLTRYSSFDESMEAARTGTVTRVNLSVGDIYGGDYTGVGLPANITAAFFGKATRSDTPRDEMEDADIAKALIQMIAQNVTQLAFLIAHIRRVNRVIFTGNFLRKNLIAQQTVSYSLAKWSELDHGSGGERMEALFLKHEGYFGAVGAFLSNRLNAAGFVDVGVSPARRAAAAGGVSGGEVPLSPGDPVPSLRVLSSPLRSPSSSPPSDAVPAHRSLSAPEKQQAALEAEPEGEFTLGLQPYPAGSGPR